MSPQKAPRQIIVLDTLPRTGTDKVQKSELLPHFQTP
jgi:acyl-CoA synthetase (AMP-forming)/AMP-acid ligase II